MRPSIFEYAGGQPAFLALTNALHLRCLADPELNHPFSHPGRNPQHNQRLAAYLGEALGGPPVFTDDYGSHVSVVQMHAGEGDMGDLGRRFVSCFVQAMDDAGLPDDPEFRATMRAYLEHATVEMVGYPGSSEDVPTDLAMPHWSWDGVDDGPR